MFVFRTWTLHFIDIKVKQVPNKVVILLDGFACEAEEPQLTATKAYYDRSLHHLQGRVWLVV